MAERANMDGITAGALSRELHDRLTDSLVDRIAMTDRHTLVLHLYSQKEGRRALMLGANPSRPVFALIRGSGPSGLTTPPSFVMFLRKHLRRARLKEVSSPPGERIIHFLLRDAPCARCTGSCGERIRRSQLDVARQPISETRDHSRSRS
jgi:predicted ribosome quality control (RQC) complex YloA/Tae2 family protein